MPLELDPATRLRLLEHDDGESIAIVEKAVKLFVTARVIGAKADAEIKKLTDKANEMLYPLLFMTELEKMSFKGVGTVTFKQNVDSHKFDKGVLKTTLAENGVPADIIKKSMDAADIITGTKDYQIIFTKERAKKEK